MSGLAILILAAGRSSRMRGADKLLEPVQGRPLIRHLAEQARQLDLPVLITVPRDEVWRRAALAGLDVALVDVDDPGAGMAASLAAGITALPADRTGVMLVLGDMPEITGADMALLAEAFARAGGATISRGASADGAPGHPVVFPARLFADLSRLTGDSGARDILATEDVQLVQLPGQHAVIDLDTPEDWARWHRTGK